MKNEHVLACLVFILLTASLLLFQAILKYHYQPPAAEQQILDEEPADTSVGTFNESELIREHLITHQSSATMPAQDSDAAPSIIKETPTTSSAQYVIPPDEHLFSFAYQGNIARLTQLLDKGVSPNLQDENQTTPLMFAVGNHQLQAAQLLLQNGADPNMQNNFGHTALMWASMQGDIPLLQVLLEANASVDLTASNGNTALHMAAAHCLTDVCQKLLEAGANPYTQNMNGYTAIDAAEQMNCPQAANLLRTYAKEKKNE